MLAIFNVVVPVFAIIGLGYLAVRFKLYPREGVRGLVAFVNNFATPVPALQRHGDGRFLGRRSTGRSSSRSTSARWSSSLVAADRLGQGLRQPAGGGRRRRLRGDVHQHRAHRPPDRSSAPTATVRCRHDLLDHRLPRPGAHHHRHADDGARPPRRRAAPSGARRCRSSASSPTRCSGASPRALAANCAPAQDARAGRRLPRDDGRGRRSRPRSSVSAARSTSIGSRESWAAGADDVAAEARCSSPRSPTCCCTTCCTSTTSIARYGVLLAAMPSGINVYVFATYYNRGGQHRRQHDPDLDRAVDRDRRRLALHPEP